MDNKKRLPPKHWALLETVARHCSAATMGLLVLTSIIYTVYSLWWDIPADLLPAWWIGAAAILGAFLLEWRLSEQRAVHTAQRALDAIQVDQDTNTRLETAISEAKAMFIQTGGLFIRKNELPPLRNRVEMCFRPSMALAAYGPSLRGLLAPHFDLFAEHVKNGGIVRLALLSPDHVGSPFEPARWKDAHGLENAIRESVSLIERLAALPKPSNCGTVEWKLLSAVPEGSLFIMDVDGPAEQIQYQLDMAGCAGDKLPIILSREPSPVHRELKNCWQQVWTNVDHTIIAGSSSDTR